MSKINEDLEELNEKLKLQINTKMKALVLTILMKYFDISCKIDNLCKMPYTMNLCIKTNSEYAPGSDTAVALVDLVDEGTKEDYRFLIKSLAQLKNDDSEVVSSDALCEENKGMTKELKDNIDTVDIGVKHANIATGTNNPDGEYNVYGSKLEDIREINRLKDENLELKLIIGEMQLEIYKLHRKNDEKE